MCLSWWNKRRKVWQNWFTKMQENCLSLFEQTKKQKRYSLFLQNPSDVQIRSGKAWSKKICCRLKVITPLNQIVTKNQGRQADKLGKAVSTSKPRLWSPQCPIAGQWPCPGIVYDFKDQIAMLKSWLSLWLFCIMNRDNRQLWHLEPFSCLTSTLSGGAAHIACRGEIKI